MGIMLIVLIGLEYGSGILANDFVEMPLYIALPSDHDVVLLSNITAIVSRQSVTHVYIPVTTVNTTDEVCQSISFGSRAILLPSRKVLDQLVADYSRKLGIPQIRMDIGSPISRDRAFSLYYSRESIGTVTAQIVKGEEWPQVVLVYQTAQDLEDMISFASSGHSYPPYHTYFAMVANNTQFHRVLTHVRNNLGVGRLIVHMRSIEAYIPFFEQVASLDMCSGLHTLVCTHPDLLTLPLLSEPQYSTCNITAYSMLDFHSSSVQNLRNNLQKDGVRLPYAGVTLYSALWWDWLHILRWAENTVTPQTPPTCEGMWLEGRRIREVVVTNRSLSGVSGPLLFKENGKRTNYTLHLYTRVIQHWKKFAEWSSGERRLSRIQANTSAVLVGKHILEGQTLKVTIYMEEPFVMLRKRSKDGVVPTGNDRYEGYCIDLLKKIAAIRGFNYTLHMVKDGAYGSKESNGKWNGMVGELQRGEADLAVASLTISYSRSEVIDFTVPYMHLGISILFKKSEVDESALFTFLSPLSWEVWLSIAASYLATSLALWILARISPFENTVVDHENGELISIRNQFTLFNAFWFPVCSLMQQGSELNPRALCTRCVTLVWWFFTLILISSYTANLAAFLTTKRMESPIENADDLSKQTKIKYGTLGRGSTMTFFNESKIETYERMWKLMSGQPNLFVNSSKEGIARVKSSEYAYLMESSMLEYAAERDCKLMQIGGLLDQKGYGIGLPKGSPYREHISTAILSLQEKTILTELKDKWWKDKGTVCDHPTTKGSDESGTVRGIFVLLISGLALSLFLSLIEFFVASKQAPPKNEKEDNGSESPSVFSTTLYSRLRHALCCAPIVHNSSHQEDVKNRIDSLISYTADVVVPRKQSDVFVINPQRKYGMTRRGSTYSGR